MILGPASPPVPRHALASTSKVLGILGGTFDPVHCGHVQMAQEVREALRLPEVLLMPAGDPPHRARPGAGGTDRAAMVALAIAGHPGLGLDDREIRRQGPSYTVLTLEELRSERPFQPLALILGADAFLGLPAWHRWREVLALTHLIVVARPGLDLEAAIQEPLAAACRERLTGDPRTLETVSGGSIYHQSITPHAISASAIRDALARGAVSEVRGTVPAAVLSYIQHHHLYELPSDAI
ncbi:MAG: nicotinate-nucleotide adenylyltransferase [Pseudomonadota bacterium]|nr:nicotinate-nucleotide adenylyltransferase [Pseudomonadota bacterium]